MMYFSWSATTTMLLTWIILSHLKDGQSAIVGGHLSKFGSESLFPNPYTVSVRRFMEKGLKPGYYWKEQLATGVIISTNSDSSYVTVLTSAHSFLEKPKMVRIGIGPNVQTQQVFDVEEWFLHPKYNPSIKGIHDLVLLRIPKTDALCRLLLKIEPLVLSRVTPPSQLCATVSGFGILTKPRRNTKAEKAEGLQSLEMPLIAPELAQDQYQDIVKRRNAKEDPFTKNEVLCTFSKDESGPSPGDSGGGLVVTLENESILVGITSWGLPLYEAGQSTPFVFTNIAAQYDFINEHEPKAIWTESLDKLYPHGESNFRSRRIVPKEPRMYPLEINPITPTLPSMLIRSTSGMSPGWNKPVVAQLCSLWCVAHKMLRHPHCLGKKY